MSTGSASIPLLKAAPEADQVAERLAGGPWAGLELCLMPGDVARRRVHAARRRRRAPRRRRVGRRGRADRRGARVAGRAARFVRVDRLDAEAREGIDAQRPVRGGDRLAGPHHPPLHPADAGGAPRVRRRRRAGRRGVPAVLRAGRAASTGSTPLIENVPPVLRMRTGGVFLHADRRALARPALVAGAGPVARLHARHLPRRAVPHVRRRVPVALGPGGRGGPGARAATSRSSGRRARSRTSPTRRACSARGSPTTRASSTSTRSSRASASCSRTSSPRSTSPTTAVSPSMKAGYGRVARALPTPAGPWRRPPRRLPGERFDWQIVIRRRDPVPAVLELEEALSGRRVLVTGGAGSIGRSLTTLLEAFRPRAHHGARRTRGGAHRRPPRQAAPRTSRASSTSCATCATAAAWRPSSRARRPTSSSTSPPTSTSTGPSATRRSSRRRTSTGAGTSCAAPRRAAPAPSSSRRPTRPRGTRRSTGGRSGSWRASRASRRSARAHGRAAVRLVNVLGSARQRLRAVAAPGPRRRPAHASPTRGCCATGSRWPTRRRSSASAILPGPGLLTAADPVDAHRRRARRAHLARRGRRRRARLPRHGRATGRDDGRGARRRRASAWATRCGPGVAGIERAPTADVGALVDEVEAQSGSEERRAVWLRALGPTPVVSG